MSVGFDSNYKIVTYGLYSPIYKYNVIASKGGIDISMDSKYSHLADKQLSQRVWYWRDKVAHFEFEDDVTTEMIDGKSVIQGGKRGCNLVFHLSKGIKYTVYTEDGYFFIVEVLGTDERVPKMVNSAGLLYYMGCVWGEVRLRIKLEE